MSTRSRNYPWRGRSLHSRARTPTGWPRLLPRRCGAERQPRSNVALTSILPEADNVRAALTWAFGPGNDPNLGSQIAGDALYLWFDGGMQADGRHFLEVALAQVDELRNPQLAALLLRGLGALRQGTARVAAARRAVLLYERAADDEGLARAYLVLASGLWQTNQLGEAEKANDRALSLMRQVGLEHTWHDGNALDSKGYILSQWRAVRRSAPSFRSCS